MTELFLLLLYICAWFGPVIALLMTFLKNASMYIFLKEEEKVKLFIHDCLPILVLLYIMLAYLMMFAALSNYVCLHNAFFH